jgi:hypothetical protein
MIRATRDTFSEERKICFIRELAAEGFIPDDYRWLYNGPTSNGCSLIRWSVDRSWCELSPHAIAETRRFMLKIIAGGILLWLLLMVCVFLSSAQHGLSSAHQPVTVNKHHG